MLAKTIKTAALIALLLSTLGLWSQDKIAKNVKAEGRWDVVGEVSPAEAREKALFEAQKNALRIAGIPTDVRSFAFSSIVSDGTTYNEEDFTQLNAIYIQGKVVLKKEPVFTQHFENGTLVVSVSIVADVLADAQRDSEFAIDVQGFQTLYHNGDELTFSVKPFKDCYLRIFWFENTTAGTGDLLYPIDDYNNDILLQANTTYQFPLSPIYERNKMEITYEITKQGKKNEQNIFFIIATKKKIPFVGEVNYDRFFKWYNQIAGDERTEIVGRYISIF